MGREIRMVPPNWEHPKVEKVELGGGFFAEIRDDKSVAIQHRDGGLHMASRSELAMVRSIADQVALIRELVGALEEGEHWTAEHAFQFRGYVHGVEIQQSVEKIRATLSRVPEEYK